MATSLDERALDTLFRAARTQHGWQDTPIYRREPRVTFSRAITIPIATPMSRLVSSARSRCIVLSRKSTTWWASWCC